MKNNEDLQRPLSSKILFFIFVLGGAAFLAMNAVAQQPAKSTASASASAPSESPVQDNGWPFAGLPVDWSFRHVIHTARNANSDTTRTRDDPRAYYQWLLQGHKAALAQTNTAGAAQSNLTFGTEAAARAARARKPNKPHRDWSLSLKGGTVAQNMFPAKFNFYINNTPDCTNDFVVYGLNVASTASQANLVGVNNLYSGTGGTCTGPTAYWAYNTTTQSGGKITTSPVLYTTGQEVAFIESTGSASILHVLKWKANNGTVAAPISPTSATNAATCTAPCMTSLTYDSSHGTTLSSPFYNYQGSTDTLYVGNDNGKLFQITGVFTGTPTVSTTGGWSASGVTVAAAGVKMTGPVLDANSGNIFIGGSDGKLYSVSSSTAAVNGSIAVGSGSANGGGIVDPPTIDSSNNTVLAYAAANAASVGGTTLAANTSAVVVQTTTALGSPKVATIGEGSLATTANLNVVSGSFDNAYFNWSGSGVNPGHFYAIGTTATVTSPTLYQLGYSGIASVTLNTNGAGYTTPSVSFSDATGFGAAATASGGVTGVTLTAAGSGYTAMPTASFSAPPSGTTAIGSAVTVAVTGVTVSSGGSGYTSVPNVTFAGTGSPNATATAALGVGSLNLTAAGAGYTSVPTVSFSTSGSTTAATATATLGVQSVNVTGNGAGYTSIPTVTISGGGGSGATATATVGVSSIALNSGSGTGTVTINTDPGGGSTFVIGGDTYTWHGTCGSQTFCVTHTGTTSSDAANLANAIDGSCDGAACAANPNVSATASGSVVTITNKTASPQSYSTSGAYSTPTSGTIPAGNGSAGCTNGATEPLTFTGGGGSGATGTANVSGGVVQSVTLTAAGSNYTAIPSFTAPGCTTQPSQTVTAKVTGVSVTANGINFTSVPAVSFSASGATTAATATAVLGVQTLTLNTAGTGYTSVPTVAFSTSGSTTSATATASLKVVSVTVGTAGSYTTFPTASVTGNASLSTTVNVIGLTVPSTPGSGYTTAPSITFSGGGSGATASSTINVTNVALTYGGGGYTSPAVTITGGSSNATATATVNPGAVMTPGTSSTTAVVDGTAGVQASPVTEIFTNASTDLLFYGDGIAAGPSNLTALNVTTPTNISPSVNGVGIAEPAGIAGTSGIVVDNISTEAQASSIYFATQGTSNNCGTGVYCAVKLTQSGLQ